VRSAAQECEIQDTAGGKKDTKVAGFRWSRPTSAVISINRLALNTCGYLPQRLQASVC